MVQQSFGQIFARSVVIVAVLSLAAAGPRDSSSGGKMLKLHDQGPRFSLQDETGRNVTMDELTGKIVVLEWFDPRNDYTRRDTKAGTNRTLAARYKDKGVIWLAVNSTRGSEVSANKRWVDDHKLAYRVLDDSRGSLAQSFGITTAPFYFILDKNGRVVFEGSLDDDDNRSLDQGPKDGRINFVDRALAQLTTGQQVDRPTPRVYGDPLNQ